MAKPSKIIFCRYSHPFVEEIAEFKNNKLLEAKYAVRLHNIAMYGLEQELENQFYFLNTKINGKTTIITEAGQRDYPANDPQIIAKLSAYLEQQAKDRKGTAQNRATYEPHLPEKFQELPKESYVLKIVSTEAIGLKVILELRILYSDKLTATYFLYKGKPTVKVVSKYFTRDEIKIKIEEILNI